MPKRRETKILIRHKKAKSAVGETNPAVLFRFIGNFFLVKHKTKMLGRLVLGRTGKMLSKPFWQFFTEKTIQSKKNDV